MTDEYLLISTYDTEKTLYDIKIDVHNTDDKTIQVFYSELDSSWTEKCRGKLASKLKLHGNGIKIQFPGSKKPIELDFSQFAEIQMMCDLYSKLLDSNPEKYTLLKKMDEKE